ncbi:MAG: HINT domain-containing protein [Anaerolineae bacterium]|nr:HINT domain-containing protein [Anaerolineae bacterium]
MFNLSFSTRYDAGRSGFHTDCRSYGAEVTGEVGTYEVTHVHIHDDPLIVHLVISGEVVETTPEHPFYLAGGHWIEAGDLVVGDQIRTLDGSYGTVERVTIITQTETMYNLMVDEAHTFFVGDGAWLVHNGADVQSPDSQIQPETLKLFYNVQI